MSSAAAAPGTVIDSKVLVADNQIQFTFAPGTVFGGSTDITGFATTVAGNSDFTVFDYDAATRIIIVDVPDTLFAPYNWTILTETDITPNLAPLSGHAHL